MMEALPSTDGERLVRLSGDEIGQLSKELRGQGGFQTLLSRLKANCIGDLLVLTPDLASRVLRYLGKYGEGGWQSRLKQLPSVVEAAQHMAKAGDYLPHLLAVREEEMTEEGLAPLDDDLGDQEEHTAPIRYSISSYGADYTVDGLVDRLEAGDVIIPSFQRGFVWTHRQASRFIESLLLGLPTPGVFLSKESETKKLLVIDGQQRLRTLEYFFAGTFGEDGPRFALAGVDPAFDGATYASLDESDKRQLKDSIIHATVIKQDEPPDDESSIYYIFERINTGGTELSPQEIRASIYHGSFTQLLGRLNRNEDWRLLFGTGAPNARGRDQELILRFLALFECGVQYKGPMASFLNRYLGKNRDIGAEHAEVLAGIFEASVQLAAAALGADAFRPRRVLNAAIADSVLVGLARRCACGPVEQREALREAHLRLVADGRFVAATTTSTANEDHVAKRLQLATEAFAKAR